MPAPFPHQYETTLVRTEMSRGRIEGSYQQPIQTSPSPQLDGDATAWSGEQLLMSALATSLHTTFEAFAVRDGIQVHSYESKVRATVERTARGLVVTKVTLEIDLDTDNNERALDSLADAQRYCLVAQALRVPVEIVANARDNLRNVG
jgi:organic hydroperoxide reductase OsmC/OhrA